MPKGPKGKVRSAPADVIGNSVKVMRITTGEETESVPVKSAAATLGSLGGKARSRNMTPDQRSRIAHRAATARWKKEKR